MDKKKYSPKEIKVKDRYVKTITEAIAKLNGLYLSQNLYFLDEKNKLKNELLDIKDSMKSTDILHTEEIGNLEIKLIQIGIKRNLKVWRNRYNSIQ